MKIEDIINAMDDSEKDQSYELLFEWKRQVNWTWARDWLVANSSSKLGKCLINDIKSKDKISAIKCVRNILDVTLVKAKNLVEQVIN
jgi:ribosomal protein L7/L12